MGSIRLELVSELYAGFDAPITALDCGDKCAPYNQHGVPFCCDSQQVVPTAYDSEWIYLQENSDLWHLWQGESAAETAELMQATPSGQVLIECKGHQHCQRDYRSFTCRAFPFFPYLNSMGEFIGISYYAEYAAQCWLISNLPRVERSYLNQFVQTYEWIFDLAPAEKENFFIHSAHVRETFAKKRRQVVVISRNGEFWKIRPTNESVTRINPAKLSKLGPYRIAARLPFPGEDVD